MHADETAIRNYLKRNEISYWEFAELTGIGHDETDRIFEGQEVTYLTIKKLIDYFGEEDAPRYLGCDDYEIEYINGLSEHECTLYDNGESIDPDSDYEIFKDDN